MTEYADHIYYRKVDDHAKNMPSSMYYGKRTKYVVYEEEKYKYTIQEIIKYVYDKIGNISRIEENGAPTVWYKYDALNRLIREDNKTLGGHGYTVTTTRGIFFANVPRISR